jgi:hypothetical protein
MASGSSWVTGPAPAKVKEEVARLSEEAGDRRDGASITQFMITLSYPPPLLPSKNIDNIGCFVHLLRFAEGKRQLLDRQDPYS